jgi:NAD(P)H dehydrogenase (quinone)
MEFTMSNTQPTLLVTGAGGQLGHRVVELLLARGAGKVIAGSRDPAKLADLTAKGAETRKVDFDDPELAKAFAGVDRLLVISTDALDKPGRRLAQHRAAVAAAAKAGVKHVVYTSMTRPEPGSLIPFAPDHYGTEQALKESGLTWTILRTAWYAENLAYTLPAALATGKWVTSAGTGRIPYITREDCAEAAAAALASSSTENVRYDVTGPASLTTAETAALVSSAFDTPITVVHVGDDELTKTLSAAGVPPLFVTLLVSFDANTRAGQFDLVSDDFKRLTGKTPRPLKDFLAVSKGMFLKHA